MKRVTQDELEARAAIYQRPIEIDTEANIAVLTAAGRTWYASLAEAVTTLGDAEAVAR